MPQLQITCFGTFQVLFNNEQVTAFPTDKARALLVYLAVDGRAHARTALAQLLWPGYSEESANNSLRQTLHRMRQLFPNANSEQSWLLITRHTVQMNPDAPIQVDVATFRHLLATCVSHEHTDLIRCAACLDRLRQAVALYRDDFLAGFTVADSDPFEEWRRIIQEQLHIQMLDALTSLAAAAELAGEDEQAIQMAHRLLTLEPWLEAAHRQIMRLLAQRGQRAAALAQYQRCCQILAEELGGEPEAETIALYEQIRSGQFQSPRVTAPTVALQPPLINKPTVVVQPTAPIAPPAPLLGRADELLQIATLLEQPTCRLLTLVGPPGVGKTRLAQAVAAQLVSHFTAGVCLVELAALTEPTLLPQTVAAALGQAELTEARGDDPVVRYVGDKSLLLLLDNCEHMDEAVAYWIGRWLIACPMLRILATSQGAIAIPGEVVWPVSTLAYPPATALASDQLSTYAAVQLFVARAKEVKADFALTAANSAAVAEICRRLEGIPLALELAAARVRSQTPTEIAERLSKGMSTALSNNRSAPARHQTMQAALNWSFASLDADEQLLFQQLAVFAGGFTLSAVEIVTQLPDALDILDCLIDRSLVIAATLGEQTRYRLLGVIRKYADDKLSASGMAPALRQRHALYFLQLAESTQIDPHADGEALWLQPEVENLGSAVDWALANNETNIAVRLAGALTWYWWIRGYLRSQRAPLQRAQELANQQQETLRNDDPFEPAMRALAAGALFALWEELDKARLAFTQALALAEAEPNQPLIGLALRRLVAVMIQQKAYGPANQYIERGLAVWQALGGIWHIAWLYAHQGDLADERGDQTQAWLAYEASSRLPVNPGVRAYAFRRMAYLAMARGERSQALALCRESLQLNLACGDRQGIAACLVGVACFTVAGVQTLPQAVRLSLLHSAAELIGAAETLLKTVEGRLLQADEAAYQQIAHLLQVQLESVASETYQAALAAGRSLTVEQATALALQEEPIVPRVDPIQYKEIVGSQTDKSNPIDSNPTGSNPPGVSLVHVVPLYDWVEMPVVDLFVERQAEMAQLTAWLAPTEVGVAPARLISILGMGGIGKTTLAAVVTKAVAANFAVVIWRSLLNAPPLSELLQNWLQILSHQTLTTLPDSLDEQLRLLLTYLQQERCLLVLDNVESIFVADPSGESTQSRAGVVRPDYKDYDQLFQRVAGSEHQSCLLLTSREQPCALLRSGRQGQMTGRVQVLPLAGLDSQAGYTLLQRNGLHPSAAEAAQLVENYSGNPLALQIVAATITDFFGGDVTAFRQEEGQLFDGIRMVLSQQFARLSPLEREILIWLAIEREPVTVQLLRSNFVQPVTTAALLEALQALQNRSLLEKRDTSFTLQNVIIEYATECLVEQVCQEIVAFGSLPHESPISTVHRHPLQSAIQNSVLNRFVLLKAQANEYVRQSQERLIVQPLVEQLVAKVGKVQITASIPSLLDSLRNAEVKTGYAAGNLLNLVLAMKIDGGGFDFSGLALRQAFLRGRTIHNVNFCDADLSDVVFTDNFSLINSVAINPAQTLIAAGTGTGEIRIWHYSNRQPAVTIQRHQKPVWAVVFSPNGRILASSDDQTVQLWEIEVNGELIKQIQHRTLVGHRSDVHTLAFSPDGKMIASAGYDHAICLWDMESGDMVQRFTGHSSHIYSIAFSPEGRLLASGSDDQTVRIWDLQNQQHQILQGHTGRVYDVAFHPQGGVLATCGTDHSVRLWDVAKGELCQTLQGHSDIVRSLVFHPTGEWLASGSYDETIRLWSIQRTSEEGVRGEIHQILYGHTAWVRSVIFSPDGKTLISGSIDNTLRIWGLQGGLQQAYHVLHGHTHLIRAVAVSPDGDTLVSGSNDYALRIWDIHNRDVAQVRQTLLGHTRMIRTIAFHPNGRTIASGGFDKSIRLWVKKSDEWQLQHTLTGHSDLVRSVAFSPDGVILASAGSDQTIHLWEVATGRLLHRLDVGGGTIWSVAFHPDRQTLVSGSADGIIRLWNLDRQSKVLTLSANWHAHTDEIKTVAFSPDGQTLASGSDDKTIRLWSVPNLSHEGRLSQTLPGHTDTIWSIAFCPDGQTLASCSADQTVRLWAIHNPTGNGAPYRILKGHTSWVWTVVYSPDGQTLISCSDDETIRFWDLSGASLVPPTVLRIPGPYADMKITGATGISEAQQAALKVLGAVDEVEDAKETRREEAKKNESSDHVGSVVNGSVLNSAQSPGQPVTFDPRSASPLLDLNEMPAVDLFVERQAEVAQLMAWLVPTEVGAMAAHLISILGMGGMGKTTLAAMVTKAVAPNFAVVIWRSLLNAPPLSELLRSWLQTLSRQTLTTLPESLDEQLRLLLTYLQQERCLLVLDNVESIFAPDTASESAQSRAGVVRPGYAGYDQLFQRLASSDHQSCLLLTSREQPYALLRSGRQAQTSGRVQVLPLTGLDPQSGYALLQSNGLHPSAAEAAQLVENYSGNPLALQIVAATIADFFGGDVAAFQEEEGALFDGMRLVLDQQFARLSPLEREILIWLAIEREPITVPILRQNLVQTVATAPLLEALQALQNRSLLEKREAGFTLQNVIIEYMTEHLVEQVVQEILHLRTFVPNAEFVNPKSKIEVLFLNRFALLKAQAKEYVRQSQVRLILQPVAQQLVHQLGQSSLLRRSQELLELLRKRAPCTPGYAAGNLLNLLLALGIDLTDCDFSNLCVWQPYLRQTTLTQLNFANSDLRGATFTDTFDIVRALAYSLDGRFLAAGTSDGEIRLWRAADGQLLSNVKGHGDIVSWLCFLDDGNTLISYSHDLALAVWQIGSDPIGVAAGEAEERVTLRLLYHNIELSNLTNLVAFHPQNELFAFGTERGWLCLWHLGTRRQLSEQIFTVGQIHTLRFSPDGKTLAIGTSDRRIHLWDVDAVTGRLALRQSLAEMSATAHDLSFRSDGRILASGHEDGSIQLWELDAAGCCITGQTFQQLLGHRAGVWRLVFSPDGQRLASGSDDHSVLLWAIGGTASATRPAQPLARLDEHHGWVRSLAFTPDGLSLASAGSDRTIRVWDLRCAQLLYTLYGYVKAVKSIAFYPKGRLLVSGSDDQHVRLWDVASGRCLQTWVGHTGFIWQVAVSPDGRMVASAGDDRQIYVRDASNGQVLKILNGHDNGATAVAFSPDGKLLASGGIDCRVILWDMQESSGRGMQIRTWNSGTQVVWTVAFSPNGEYLAMGGEPNRIRLWHLPTQQFHPSLENKTGVLRTLAFSPDSRWLVAAGHDAILYLWQVGSGAPPILLPGHQNKIRSVVFSPDGQRLATASFDQTVRLWDLQKQTQIRTLPGHNNQVLSVAFSDDGKFLASASEDETIRLWHGETGEPLAVLPIPGPYAGMKIDGVTGISDAQKAALKALGAVDEAEEDRVTPPSGWTEQGNKITESPNSLATSDSRSASPLLDWAEMPAVDFFVERRAEVAQLTAWLVPTGVGVAAARLISILGMGGMGKTTLAAVVTKTVAANFAVVIWRSLLNAPPISELLRNWLQTLSRQTLTNLPDSLDEQLRLLLTYLQQERCLLVLDNVESLFAANPSNESSQSRAGGVRPGYEGYDQLFQRLASSAHQSCLLLTSREQPYALLRSGRQAQTTGRIQVLPLTGLDPQAGYALLQSNGLHTSADEAAQLVKNYSGNPLALQIVAATIADFFGGDVAAFRQEEGALFDGMRLVLDQQFARLSALERDVLVWLAIEREPITVPTLRSNFVQPVATAPLLEALQALQNRSLLEKRDDGFTLQNVIIEYTTEYLVTEVCRELMEDKEIRRQEERGTGETALALSFLNRFALLKAQSKEYTRQSQERLILQPVAIHWQKSWGQKQENIHGQQLLNALRQQGVQEGYAAGNLLNLLIYLGVDLNGYDFSQLPVWQADLRRSVVRNVNLAQADLSNSAFIQTFSRIENVAISPDGQLLAAAGDGGTIRLFHLPNGEPHHQLIRHTNTVTSVSFSPDGAYLASTGDDGLVLLWAIHEGQLHRQLGEYLAMRVVTFSPDGRLLAGASRSGFVLLWQVENGHLLRTLPLHNQRVNALAFHPDGNLLASASSDGTLSLLNVNTLLHDEETGSAEGIAVRDSQQVSRHVRSLVADPQASFFTVAFSPDGQRLVAGGGDGKLYVWNTGFDVATHHALGHGGQIRSVVFCADSRFFFSGGYDGAIRLWDSQDMRCCQTLSGHQETVYSLALGRQDQLMASGSEDATICLWEINTQTQSILRQRLHGYPQALECVAWSGCGRWLATGDIHGAVRLWDLQHATPRCTQEISGESTVISLSFTQDGQQLVIGRYADPKGIQIWEVRADSQWYLRGGQKLPLSGVACFSADASLLATCANDGTLRLWNTQSLAELAGPRLFSGHRTYVNRMTFTANGQTLATCSGDLSVRLWQIDTGEETHRLPGFGNNTCLAVNPQGTLLACSAPNFAIALWNVADPAAEGPLYQLIGHTNEAFACAFSPDGQLLVSAGLDRSVRLWDVQTATQRALLGYHEQYALDVAFSPNGQQIASIGKEGALYIWQIKPYKRLHQLHAPGPYAGMKITDVTGISEAQKAALRVLGAIEG